MKQRLYIENNQVVVNPEKKPSWDTRGIDVLTVTHDELLYEKYNKALSEWQKNCKPVENIEPYGWETGNPYLKVFNGKPISIPPGTLCETTETEPYRVTKIY